MWFIMLLDVQKSFHFQVLWVISSDPQPFQYMLTATDMTNAQELWTNTFTKCFVSSGIFKDLPRISDNHNI